MIHFPAIDLDIDSDANGTLDRSVAEDVTEADQTKGLFFPVHSGDLDADGIPDNFDFNGVAGLSFTPMALSLSSNVAFAYATQITLTFNYDAAGLTIGDTGLFRIWTKDASQARTSSDLIPSGQPIDAWSIGLTPGSSISLYLEAVNSTRRTVNFDPISVTADLTGGSIQGPQAWYGTLTDKVHASGIDVRVDAKTISHNTAVGILDKTSQNTVGAFLPVNDDDDDYTATPASAGTPGSNGADFQQAGAIQGENDLLPIILRKIKRGGTFRLEIPNHLRVWKNANRTDQVTATTDINANVETTLYVEGISKASGDLKVNWTLGAQSINNSDQLKVTAFQWSGPLNVPGYSIYNYKAEGALGTSKWVTPADGTIKTGANTSDVTILWGEGAVVGKAIYEVNSKYTWDLEVNVVRITPTQGTVTAAPGKAPKVPVNPAFSLVIISAPGKIRFQSRVTIQGSGADGKRGLKFMEIGYIQNVSVTAKNGSYPGGTLRTSSIEGKSYVDPAPGSTLPWSDSTLAGAFWSPTANGHHDFDHSDQPSLGVRTTLNDLVAGPLLTQGNIKESFARYLAVRTTQSVNGSENIYTQRANALWLLDYSGTVDAASDFNPSAANALEGPTTNDFTLVTNGSTVPIIDGEAANDATNNETWTTN